MVNIFHNINFGYTHKLEYDPNVKVNSAKSEKRKKKKHRHSSTPLTQNTT